MLSNTFDIFIPPPRYNVREWADEFRFLSSEASAKPGKYRSSFAPYQQEPMQSANDETVQSVCLMFASQTGKTEIINNVVGYYIAADPSPILMVQPTVEFAEAWSKERLVPMIRDTPALFDRVKDPKSRDSGNTILSKQFAGGNIAIVGANAPSGLAGRPRRVVLMDEVDRYPVSAGTEGDPCSLAVRRTESFWNAIVYLTSTPTTKGASRIEAEYEQTDKRMWFCPCPHCGERQVLMWKQVKWEGDDYENAWIECEHNQCKINDDERRQMVLAGEWRATAPFNGKRGYWLNGINSPFKHKRGYKNRIHQMVAQFIEAKAGGPETLKTWVNTFLAETWEEEGTSIEPNELLERRRQYGPQLPEGALVLVGGVDTQDNRIELEVVAFGEGEESWGIKYSIFIGDTSQRGVYEEVGEFMRRTFQHPTFGEMNVSLWFWDTKGHRTTEVTEFIYENQDLPIKPINGSPSRLKRPVVAPTGKSQSKQKIAPIQIDTHVFKDQIHARLKVAVPGPRYMHFPTDYDEEWFKQLTGERKVISKGKVTWEPKPGHRNEAFDIRVYAHAALFYLNVDYAGLRKNLEKMAKGGLVADIRQSNVEAQPNQPTRHAPRRSGGFVNGWRR